MNSPAKLILAALAFAALLLPPLATAQAQPLTITDGPRIEYVGPNIAEIAWTTSTGGSTVLRYGTDPNNLNQTAQEPYASGQGSQHVTHRVKIQNLQPNTKYYFMVDSAQGQGTGTEAKSSVQSFATTGGTSGQGGSAALQITDGPRVEYVGTDKAEIAWTTSTGGSSLVRYGTDPNNLSQTAQAPYDRSAGNGRHVTHRVTINNLQPNTTYYFAVDSGQGEGTGTEVKSQVAQFTTNAANASGGDKVPLYRGVSPTTGDHVFTSNYSELSQAVSSGGYQREGIAGYVQRTQAPGTDPFYRLMNPKTGDHFYTTSAPERQSAMANGYQDEGIAGYIASSQQPGTVPLYRMLRGNKHFYTANPQEQQADVQQGWRDEGIAGYIWQQGTSGSNRRDWRHQR